MRDHFCCAEPEDPSRSHRTTICTFGGSELEPAEYEALIWCPWCSDWHSCDDDLCPAIPVDTGGEITEDDIDWADWIDGAA